MADKPSNGKSVLGSLPKTRPERLGGPRGATSKKAPAKPAAAKAHRHGPAAVSLGSPRLERRHPGEPPPDPLGPPRGTELVTTAIHATGELARIGLTVGGQVLKRAVDRLPRP